VRIRNVDVRLIGGSTGRAGYAAAHPNHRQRGRFILSKSTKNVWADEDFECFEPNFWLYLWATPITRYGGITKIRNNIVKNGNLLLA